MKKRFPLLIGVAGLLALTGTVLLIVSNATPNQDMHYAGLVIAVSVAAVIALAFSTFFIQRIGDGIANSGICLLGMIGIAVGFCFLIANRVPLVVNLATWDGLNKLGWTAFYTGAAAILCDLLAMILLSITMFRDNSLKR